MTTEQEKLAKEHLITVYAENEDSLAVIFKKINELGDNFGFTSKKNIYETSDLAGDNACRSCTHAIQFGIQNDALTSDELYSICLIIRLGLSDHGMAFFLESDINHNNAEAGIHANRFILIPSNVPFR